MKAQLARQVAPKLVISGLLSFCLLSANAMASDAVIGALLGGGAGAFVGQSIGGRDATIIGGAIGAAAGAAIGSERGRTTYVERRVEYVPPYAPPRVQYIPPPPPAYYYYSQPAPVVYSRTVRVVQSPVYVVKDKHHRHSNSRNWKYVDRRYDRYDD